MSEGIMLAVIAASAAFFSALLTLLGTLWVTRSRAPNEAVASLAQTVKTLTDENARLRALREEERNQYGQRISMLEMHVAELETKLQATVEMYEGKLAELYVQLGQMRLKPSSRRRAKV